jgi:hypothetical protein
VVRYAAAGDQPVAITTAAGAAVVAPIAGTLRVADPADAAAGIGFWVVGPEGDRVGLGPLASYQPDMREGSQVVAGQQIGRSTGGVTVSWRRGDAAMDIHAMLAATRPSD